MAADQVPVVEPVLFPGGVADREATTGYIADSGGITAVELLDGRVSWRSDEARRPLIVVGEQLVAVAASQDSPNELRVMVLDARRGEPILTSAPVVFPAWLSPATEQPASFWCAARVEGGRVLLDWRAHARYRGGAAPSAEIRREATHDAGGLVEIDLESGAVAPQVDADESPRSQPAAVRTPPLADDDSGEPWLAGTTVARLMWEHDDGEQTLLLEARDRSTEAADTVVELARGRGLVARVALDGRHVFVHEEQGPDPPQSWWVLSAQTGARVATLSFEAGSRSPVVLGERAYYLVDRKEDAVRAPKLSARELASDRLAWELPLGQWRAARAPPLRQ